MFFLCSSSLVVAKVVPLSRALPAGRTEFKPEGIETQNISEMLVARLLLNQLCEKFKSEKLITLGFGISFKVAQ